MHMFLNDISRRIKQSSELRDWKRNGKPIPPPHLIKQRVVKEHAKKFSINTLVETGTFLGDMVDATKDAFTKIFSIELDQALYEQAKRRFSDFDYISVIQGDSADVLPSILANITHPCLFWLDGHYSAGITARGKLETPVVQELISILDHHIADHVVLIDDARLFVGQHDYPTLAQLQKLVSEKCSSCSFKVLDDIIRIHRS